jgi:hypothetical protein
MIKKIMNEVWVIPTLLLGFFLMVELSHMYEHSHCRSSESSEVKTE